MGKNKKNSRPTLDDALAQPWCYYCEKVYADVGALLSHQKDKHFQCACRRRLNTAGGLKVHMAQVHKEELKEVPNALDHRKDPSVEVFTMYGIPEDIMRQRRQDIEAEFHREEHERRIRTGNTVPGGAQPGPAKKTKTESSDSLKARVAQRRAENAARRAAEANSTLTPPTNSPAAANTPNTVTPSGVNGASLSNSGDSVTAPGNLADAFPGVVPSPSHTFEFQASPFSPPPNMISGLVPLPHNGFPLPTIPGMGMPNAGFFANGPLGLPHMPNMPGQWNAPPVNGGMPPSSRHAIPANPHASSNTSHLSASVSNAKKRPISSLDGSNERDDASGSDDDSNDDSSQVADLSLNDRSLPKLCELGITAIKMKLAPEKVSNLTPADAEEQPNPDELFAALFERLYIGVPESTYLGGRAEDVLLGMMIVGIVAAPPTDTKFPDKLHNLQALSAKANALSKPVEETQPGKKKVPEKWKLANNGESWEEIHATKHKSNIGQGPPTQIVGPVGDAVTGVVGNGELGDHVMEG